MVRVGQKTARPTLSGSTKFARDTDTAGPQITLTSPRAMDDAIPGGEGEKQRVDPLLITTTDAMGGRCLIRLFA